MTPVQRPRLVEVYDAGSPWGRDVDYFLALADETPGARVLDVGCGTGRLALRLASAGHAVTGIDPSPAALAAARTKPGAERVTWIHGTAQSVPEGAFDVAVMTGHVSQFLLGEGEWARALRALRRALVRGGRLAFHAYDPGNVKQVYAGVRGLKELVWASGAQIDFYDRPEQVEQALGAIRRWFARTLAGRPVAV